MENDLREVSVGALLTALDGTKDVATTVIKRQEERGQANFVNSTTLPRAMKGECNRSVLETMGVVFKDEADDLFVNVELPKGWKKVAEDHDMWSKLVDDQGRERASIFYKADFHDRSAHISLSRRFSASYEPEDEYKSDLDYKKHLCMLRQIYIGSERDYPGEYKRGMFYE